MRISYINMTLIISGFGLLAACSEEPLPRSVSEFMKEPAMLEAAMLRCLQDRSATRYDGECVNARQAAQIIDARERRARKDELEARSLRKRQALRRTQEAASEARRRALDNENLRIEDEYIALFGPARSLEREVFFGEQEQFLGGQEQEQFVGEQEEVEARTDLESVRNELKRRNDKNGN
jgi:hypothetical protein